MEQQTQLPLRDTTNLTKWVAWFLYAHIAVSIIATISGIMEYNLLTDYDRGMFASDDEFLVKAEANDARQGVIGMLQMLLYLVAGIVILRWIYFANYNARRLGAVDMQTSPGWAVGYYFVPILNLWRPYSAMKEIWQASVNAVGWRNQPVSNLLPLWWFLWIANAILGNLSFRLSFRAQDIQDFISSTAVTIISDIVWIPLCFVFLTIIRRISEMQYRQYTTSAL